MKKATLACFLLMGAFGTIRGQSISPSTLNSTGGSKTIGTDTWEWSVGEMTLVHTASASNIIVTQGLLQPAPTPTDIRQEKLLSQLLSVFPNPSASIVNIRYNFTQSGTLHYTLQDMTGKKLSSQSTAVLPGQDLIQLSVAPYANGSYMLLLQFTGTNKQAMSTSYKIDKIN